METRPGDPDVYEPFPFFPGGQGFLTINRASHEKVNVHYDDGGGGCGIAFVMLGRHDLARVS